MIISAIFLGVTKLLGSAGIGTIFGGVMGYFNRKVDLEYKRLEYADRDKQREHELSMRDKDAAVAEKEWAGRMQVATVEGEAKVETEAFTALKESYSFAVPEAGTRMSAFNSFVRPFVSLAYFVVSSIGAGWIVYYALKVKQITFTGEQWFDLVIFVVSWFFFMASAAIGWFYAMRPGKHPPAFGIKS